VHDPTLAEILTAHGWTTVCVSANPYLWEGYGLNRGFQQTLKVTIGDARLLPPLSLPWRVVANVVGHKGAPQGLRLLRQLMQELPQPFFIFANLMDVHQPYTLPWAAAGEFSESRPAGTSTCGSCGAPSGRSSSSRQRVLRRSSC